MPGLMWRSFARRLLKKANKKRKLDGSNPRPLKKRKSMSIEACIGREVLEMLQPKAEQKKKQYDEICAKRQYEDAGNRFVWCYLEMDIEQSGRADSAEVVKMVFVCKEFAIISTLEADEPLRKIQLGTEWESKFVEWVGNDWECKHTIITEEDGTQRPKTRYDVMSMDKSPFYYHIRQVWELFE